MKYIITVLMVMGIVFPALAQDKKCYVVVENPGSYEQLVVTSITLTMIRQFVDDTVEPAPISGISNKDCIYRVNVVEQESGIKVFIFGDKISDYGKSNLRGEAGLEQGILSAIYKSLASKSKLKEICQKYNSALPEHCKDQSQESIQLTQQNTAGVQQQQNGQGSPPQGNFPPHFIRYQHPSMGFQVSYPGDWNRPAMFKNKHMVFSARGEREIPAIGIFIKELKGNFKLGKQVDIMLSEFWKKMIRRQVKIEHLHSENIELPGQIEAYQSQFNLHVKDRRTLKFSAVSTLTKGNIIVVGVWGPEQMPASLPDIITRSITFNK